MGRRRLARRGLSQACRQNAAEQHLVDPLWCQAGPPQRGADDKGPQGGGSQPREITLETSKRGARRSDDDDRIGSAHGGIR